MKSRCSQIKRILEKKERKLTDLKIKKESLLKTIKRKARKLRVIERNFKKNSIGGNFSQEKHSSCKLIKIILSSYSVQIRTNFSR